jgi:hypothetical protein
MKGSGAGKSKQQAKEEAARQAFQAMGWARGAYGQYRCTSFHLFRGGADEGGVDVERGIVY